MFSTGPTTRATAQFRATDDVAGISLPWMHGGRSHLLASKQDFQRILLPSFGEQSVPVEQPTYVELVEIAKRAVKNGELEIAEKHCSKAIRKHKLENFQCENVWEPYFYLGEVLERKAEKTDVARNLLQKQMLLLQAAALYNFTKNCCMAAKIEEGLSVEWIRMISGKLTTIQNNLVLSVGGDPDRFNFDLADKKELELMRMEVTQRLQSLKDTSPDLHGENEEDLRKRMTDQTEEIKKLCKHISSKVKQLFARMIKKCVEVLGDPPCDYEVVVLGSLAREEMTPYSDLEWAILISSEDEKCKDFFRDLTNLVHLQIINFGETILPSMGINALSGEWFYDDVTPRGVSFDGFLPQACKIPLGNMKDFELIHSPSNMAEFQSGLWYKKNPGLSEILLAVAPLEPSKHKLLDEYLMELENVLGSPCDLEDCHCNGVGAKPASRGACRGLSVLRNDFFLYDKTLPSIEKSSEDGKLYDVKKEIYRLTDRVIAGLAKYYGIQSIGCFEILEELRQMGVISSTGRENLTNAAGIALKLRISTYIQSGKQGEQMEANVWKNENVLKSLYYLPDEQELFHFFYITTPLYEGLRRCFLMGETISEAFPNQEFFDCSDAVKGNIYRRVLKYAKAVECYDRELQRNPEDIDLQLHQIDVQLETDRSAETVISIKHKLEALLRKTCKKYNVDVIVDQHGNSVPKIDGCENSLKLEHAYQLLEILRAFHHFHVTQGNYELTGHIFDQCMALEKTNNSEELRMSLLVFAYSNMPELLEQERFEMVTTAMNKLIEREGISTDSIVLLNELGGSLLVQGKYEQAYQCLQRALTMGRTLYGSNFNPHVTTTLTLLGVISAMSRRYEEGKVYYEQLLHLYNSLAVPSGDTLIREAHMSLAILCATTNRHKEAILNYDKVLALLADSAHETESLMECVTHCQMATSWYALGDNEKALKSALGAKECLSSIDGGEMRVSLTCAFAEVFYRIGKHTEAASLILERLEEVDAEIDLKQKAEYLQVLGEISVMQDLGADAERYYREVVEILLKKEEKTYATVDCLLKLCNVMLKKGELSDVRTNLEQASKFVWYVSDERKMCSCIRKIGKCWENLGDVDEAQNWYNDVLKECKKSSVLINVPLFEAELHVTLGDWAKLHFNSVSSNSNVSPSSEQSLKAQRTHYERAAMILRHQSSSGNVDLTYIQLYVGLASRYRSIDSQEEEKLLNEALKISEATMTADTTCDVVAGILARLSDIKWLQEDYVAAADILKRSVEMELHLHASDRHHPHIPEVLYRLSRLHLKNTSNQQEAIKLVLHFIETDEKIETFSDTVAKENAAVYFWSMSILFLSLNDSEKGNSVLELSNKLFEEIKEADISKDAKLLAITEDDKLPEYPHFLKIEDLVSTVLLPIFLPHGSVESLVDELLLTVEDVDSETFDPCWSSKITALTRILSKLDDLVPSTERNPVADALRPYLSSAESNFYAAKPSDDGKKQRMDSQCYESKLNLLVESVNGDLKKANILEASRTVKDVFYPFVLSHLEQHCSEIIDPAEFLMNEALKAKESGNVLMMLVYLNLADRFPSEPRDKAKIRKLRGEGNFSEGNYRIAALSFVEAAEFLSRDTTLDSDMLVERLKVFVDLTKSHILCNEVESALKVSQDGLALTSNVEPSAIKYGYEIEFALLSAKCLVRLATSDGELETAVSLCKKGLASAKLITCSTWTELWKFFTFNYEFLRLLVTALLRLNKSNHSRIMLEKMNMFLRNINCIFEMVLSGTAIESNLEMQKNSSQLYSWIGQAQIMSGEANDAEIWLEKSLSAFFDRGLPDSIPVQEEFLILLDAITEAKSVALKQDSTPFQQTIELCMQKVLEKYDDFNLLLRFFEISGEIYGERERDEEAIMVYERALSVLECMDDSTDVINMRALVIVYLAQRHGRLVVKYARKSTDGQNKELTIAEEYYQTGLKLTGNSAIVNVCYAGFICNQGRFKEASKVLGEVVNAAEEVLWNTQMTFTYSGSGIIPAVQKYVKDYGELDTTAGIVAYSVLVQAFVGMGKEREAVAATEKLSARGEEVEIFANRPPFMPYVLAACHEELSSLVHAVPLRDASLNLQDPLFPQSESDLAKLYHELNVSEDTLLDYCEELASPAAQLSSGQAETSERSPLTLSTSFGNALVKLGKEDESHAFFLYFLELLQTQEGILDKPFDTQKSILAQHSFVNEYYVYDALGELLSRRGNIDDAIKCYQHCLDLQQDYSCGQDLVATLAELYQVKALTTRNEDRTSYTEWMNAAQECFENLLKKAGKFEPFVERAFATFLCRQERFEAAIFHFKNVLEEVDETEITFSFEDKPLVSAYLQREIEARGEVCLPLKIFVHHEIASAYLKLNRMEDCQESVQEMEAQMGLLACSPDYPLILSVLGYTHKEVGNKERAAENFAKVLEMIPEHGPVVDALESCLE